MAGSVIGIAGVLSLFELSREPTYGPDFPFYPSLVTVLVLCLQVCHWGNWKEGTSTLSGGQTGQAGAAALCLCRDGGSGLSGQAGPLHLVLQLPNRR